MGNFLRDLVMTRLEAPRRNYERRIYNDRAHLLQTVQPGDVILVEGRSELSRIIQLLTSSSDWASPHFLRRSTPFKTSRARKPSRRSS